MKILLLILFTLSIPIFSETQYYNSNKSGMILEEINQNQKNEFYIIKELKEDTWSQIFSFYKEGEIKTVTEEFYTSNYQILTKKIVIDGNKKDIEFYNNRLITKIEKYKNDLLLNSTLYNYNSNKQLSGIEQLDVDQTVLYNEYYYRNSDGSLRKIFRSTNEGYYIHWFYNDGLVVESWLVEDNRSTRTKYHLDGSLLNVTVYLDNEIFSTEKFSYNENGDPDFSKKTSGDVVTLKQFNSDGTTYEIRELNNDILVKKTQNIYEDKLLIKEIITGHGKKEEYQYLRDDEDEVNVIIHKINGVLHQKTIIQSEESEIFEYYRDGVIYLKEYYINGERIQKDLFLDGELFKSESFSE